MELDEKLSILYPSVDEEVIELVIEQAQSFILDYCNVDSVPPALSSVLLDMCKQDINKLKSEGFGSESAGGSSVSYETDYTSNVYKRLKMHRKMRRITSVESDEDVSG